MEPTASRWRPHLVASILAVYFYVFMEWLFFVTKPSFIAGLGTAERLGILLITPLPLVIAVLVASGGLWLLGRIAPTSVAGLLPPVVPAAVLACCAFILIDNFTYTILGWGVGRSAAGWRSVHLVLFLLLWLGFFSWLRRAGSQRPRAPNGERLRAGIATALVLGSVATTIWRYASATAPGMLDAGRTRPAALPDILIVASDGVGAAHVSAYGYARDTTPFLRTFAEDALVCENVLPNGTSSAASIVSMLTGRLPTSTRLLQHPEILMGPHAYRHLPGILKRLGYRTIHVSARLYTDPFALNMRDAFDAANFREARATTTLPGVPPAVATAYGSDLYMLEQLLERIGTRLLHVTGVRKLENPFVEIMTGQGESDERRVAAVLDFLDRSPAPVFAHLHLMGTHPPFHPKRRVFSGSAGRFGSRTDLYDNAILDFDDTLARVVGHLRDTGKIDDTIIVVTSDHGIGWTAKRLPLVFRFPHGAYRGTIRGTAQLLDVAPTLLDYLDVPIPDWMSGRSLIAPDPDAPRPIVTAHVSRRSPPAFPNLFALAATYCQRTFALNLRSGKVTTGDVVGHTAPCDAARMLDIATVRERLVGELRDNGYDVSSLESGGG
jgi:arylsulfatase A-like enzyme